MSRMCRSVAITASVTIFEFTQFFQDDFLYLIVFIKDFQIKGVF